MDSIRRSPDFKISSFFSLIFFQNWKILARSLEVSTFLCPWLHVLWSSEAWSSPGCPWLNHKSEGFGSSNWCYATRQTLSLPNSSLNCRIYFSGPICLKSGFPNCCKRHCWHGWREERFDVSACPDGFEAKSLREIKVFKHPKWGLSVVTFLPNVSFS